MPLVEFEGVTKIYGNRAVLSGVDLTVSRGESVGIVGESGAGKTTLAAIATGQVFPTEGRIMIDGRDRDGSAANRRLFARKVQLIWQDAAGSVDPRLTVKEIIAEPMRVHGLYCDNPDAIISELLSEVGLPPELARRFPHELSGGEVQRVVIARALSIDPELLVCDEPASALDVLTKQKIANLLVDLQRKRNMALVVIAHDLGLARRMTNEIIVVYRGTIVEKGPAELVATAPLHPYTRRLFASDPAAAFRAGGLRDSPRFDSAGNDNQNKDHLVDIAIDLKCKGEMSERLTATVTPVAGRGCAFLQSCENPAPACSQESAELIRLEDGRQVACRAALA